MADVDPQARVLLEQWAAATDVADGEPVRSAESVRRDDRTTIDLQASAMPMHDV
jgi:hypothetical protein